MIADMIGDHFWPEISFGRRFYWSGVLKKFFLAGEGLSEGRFDCYIYNILYKIEVISLVDNFRERGSGKYSYSALVTALSCAARSSPYNIDAGFLGI
jgi:hypothetical protein